jgi:hypothetical protein
MTIRQNKPQLYARRISPGEHARAFVLVSSPSDRQAVSAKYQRNRF